jgi:uncharacterized repeat protein (TIGR02543 family)
MKRNFLILIPSFLLSLAAPLVSLSVFQDVKIANITFETNTGIPPQTIEQIVGNQIIWPMETKVGHDFEGWFTDVELTKNFNLNRMPVSDLFLYAKWTINQYTINFESNGGTPVNPITEDYGASISGPVNPVKIGHTFRGWYRDANLSQRYYIPGTMPAEDLDLFARWSVNQFMIYFEMNGGNFISNQYNPYGYNLNLPGGIKTGHTFVNWFTDPELTNIFTLTTMPASDITLYAKWTINQYTITFITNGGNVIETQTNYYNSSLNIPNATREGYSFEGWFTDINLTESYTAYVTMQAQSITLYAKWNSHIKINATDGSSNDVFGSSVAIAGDYMVIGANRDNSYRGAAYLYKISDTNYERKISATDGASNDFFGYSVAIDGDYIVIGAMADNSSRGSAYLYKISDTNYQRKIVATNGGTYAFFGYSVAIDDDYIVIGAMVENGSRGATYVYKISDTNYERKISATDGSSNDYFGSSVAIDDDYIVIRAIPENTSRGAAYVYKISDINYERKILVTDGASNDYFGSSVAIYDDYIVIGPYADNSTQAAAYVYKISDTNYERKILAPDGSSTDQFGYLVAIDGDHIVIGAYTDNNSRGAAYVYKISDINYERKILAPDGSNNDLFGYSVAIDGDYILIGARGDNSNRGSGYLFYI